MRSKYSAHFGFIVAIKMNHSQNRNANREVG